MSFGVDMSVPSIDSPLNAAANGAFKEPKCKPLQTYSLPVTYSPKPVKADSAVSMTVTPASATTPGSCNTSSANSPSNALSAMSSTNHSISTLPEGAVDQNGTWYATPPPLHLPQAAVSDVPSPSPSFSSAMGEALAKSKGPGLIRRLSRGAHNRLRRRASTTHTNRIRDQSAGPVLVRRRSDSTGTSDIAGDVSDLELEPPSEDGTEDNSSSIISMDPANALGINPTGRRSTGSAFEGGIAPTISAVLEAGTVLIKVTKKKRKPRKFRLDPASAKVCWDPTNPAKQFYIDDVREIRVGADARNSRQDIAISPEIEKCWMTIVYDVPEKSKGRTIKTMHLIAPNEYIVQLWTDALKTVERERIEIMNALSPNAEKSERSMQMAWKQAMTRKRHDPDQKIDFDDALWICRKLEINCSSDTVRSHFNDADRDLVGQLNYNQYELFISLFKVRKDLKAIYDSIKPAEEFDLNLTRFLNFLRDHQGIDVEKDRKYWEAKFDSYARGHSRGFETPPVSATPAAMSLQSFQNFMSSSANGVLTSANAEGPLDRPLNEYFVSSSHNTYLLGRQVAGASSVEGYISALVKGCRCIEVDCWDGKDGRPVVNHGRTLSTEVLFEDCISVISKYAFASSSYPLIVSLEVHCNPEQQAAMVEIMTRCFGDALLAMPLMTNALTLPSPEELRNRILIKVKSMQALNDGEGLAEILNGRRSRSQSSPFTRGAPFEHTTWPLSPPLQNGAPESPYQKASNTWATSRGFSNASSMTNVVCLSSSGSESEVATPSMDGKKKRKTSRIIPQLGALGVYACGIKYSDFNAPEARMYNHIYSFAENTFNGVCKDQDNKQQLEKHNMRYLMRVYPAARRIDSSNFNPLQVWRRGVQMAALNWQTYDVHQQVNEAMFAAGSDKTGYVLKPEELRQAKHLPISDMMPENQHTKDKRGMKFCKFSVEIISAQRLPRPRNRDPNLGMNPYIEFEMFSAEDRGRGVARSEGGTDASASRDGSSGIGTPVRKRTKIVEGNGFDPAWKENISMTVETKYPSLIFVRWTVWNSPDGRNLSSNSTMLATFTAKLSSLNQGYRHLPLFNAYGERYRDAKLFVKIKKDLPIALNSSMHIDEQAFGTVDPSSSPRMDSTNRERSWSRRIFSRTPSQRKKSRESSPFGSFSRTSSIERPIT
ncbi:phosphatidylinositol-specific phospholipase C-like protein 1 [Elsinoe australis]|uniref:Phosphoinositide phospholipase C n=1 Tax=Elsinoe australis TaxID=40998 RepID=A0A4U7B0W4_9PEZI|nr:phosphatidylinositol-specific phospholipase C-like protein 1 [Elsinoe australis]